MPLCQNDLNKNCEIFTKFLPQHWNKFSHAETHIHIHIHNENDDRFSFSIVKNFYGFTSQVVSSESLRRDESKQRRIREERERERELFVNYFPRAISNNIRKCRETMAQCGCFGVKIFICTPRH